MNPRKGPWVGAKSQDQENPKQIPKSMNRKRTTNERWRQNSGMEQRKVQRGSSLGANEDLGWYSINTGFVHLPKWLGRCLEYASSWVKALGSRQTSIKFLTHPVLLVDCGGNTLQKLETKSLCYEASLRSETDRLLWSFILVGMEGAADFYSP